MNNFITPEFKAEIKREVIEQTFPNLNIEHQNLLLTMLIDILDVIAIKFNYDYKNKQLYNERFRLNSYRDLKGLLNLLLPYIDENPDDNISKKNIRSLNDIYISKKELNADPTKESVKYLYSNIQYSRCKRDPIEEINFSPEHLKHNYYLLLETIQTVSNKLYINWLDILPYDALRGNLYELYKYTHKALKDKNIGYWDVCKNDKNRNYKGLYIGDIYNTIHNEFYTSVKNIKWMIYDIRTKNSYIFPLIFIVNLLFDLDDCIQDRTWNQIEHEKKIIFTNRWFLLRDKFRYSHNLINLDSLIDENILITICKSLTIFFDKYYSQIDEAKERKYTTLREVLEEEIDDLEDLYDIENLELGDTWKMSFKTISSEDIYEFLRESVQKLKRTWYGSLVSLDTLSGKYVVDPQPLFFLNTVDNRFVKENYSKTNMDKITYKNFYNFSKSLVHYTDGDKYLSYSRLWRDLRREDKDTIVSRLNWDNTETILSWFNIKRYLKRTYLISDIDEIDLYNTIIFEAIVTKLTELVFDSLLKRGVLTQFKPDIELTKRMQDTNYVKSRLQEKFKRGTDLRKLIDHTHTFLTNEKFGNFKVRRNGREVSYVDNLIEEIPGMWILTYAMDWVSQIAFYHHYLNNSIIMVTGATGVGKSSQIPKLLLYALKMLDYKDDGRIIGTQPRIPPTKLSAQTISYQLGVPIVEKIGEEEIETENYIVQYQYKNASHVSRKQKYSLKIVTDGILYQLIKENPLLKVKIDGNYTNQNLYDIIFVDEAHEHNKNMDFILSLMKYALYYNNSLKLVIISATMEEDEPTYRRFYRDINDNRMYPYNFLLEDNKLDRINVDRRLHISPPEETTRYKITDKYVPQETPEQLILRLARETTEGDFLLFKPGIADINRSISILNEILPPEIIALPYYSELDKNKRDLIENIDKRKNEIVIPRNIPFDKPIDKQLYRPVARGTYKRVVIIATTLAEASITISSLRYVIDTGSRIIGRYDPIIRSEQRELTQISESSRKQRRGRVGRVAPGDVYYLYSKGSMENNKTIFDISTSNLSENLFDLLRKDYDEKPMFTEDNDPHRLKINISSIKNMYKYNISDIIKKQYFNKRVYVDYIGDNSMYDYKNNRRPSVYYETGYDRDTLEDINGTFYIIHPEELKIERNIVGRIMNAYPIEKIDSFWQILSERIFILIDPHNNQQIIKTEYGSNISKLKELLDYPDFKSVTTYIHSRKYLRDDNNFIGLMVLLETASYSISNLTTGKIVKNKYISDITNFKIKHTDPLYKCCGDIINLYILVERLLRFIYDRINIDIFIKNIIDKFIQNKILYVNKKNSELEQLIRTLDNDGSLTSEESLSEDELRYLLNNAYTYREFAKAINDINIERWCKDNLCNYEIIKRFIDNYLQKKINMYINNNNEILEKTDDMIKPILTHDRYDRIIIPFIHGYGSQIALNINKANYYINILNPYMENVVRIKKISKKIDILDSLLDKCANNLILYLNRRDDDISIVNYIKPEYLKYQPQIYRPSYTQDRDFIEQIKNFVYNNGLDNGKILHRLKEEIIGANREIIKLINNNYDSEMMEQYRRYDESTKYNKILDEIKYYETRKKRNHTGGGITKKLNNSYIRYLIYNIQ